MSEGPSNLVLAEKIDSLRELMELQFKKNEEGHKVVEKHLAQLNGQVEKNTAFRIRGAIYFSIIIFITATAVGTLSRLVF